MLFNMWLNTHESLSELSIYISFRFNYVKKETERNCKLWWKVDGNCSFDIFNRVWWEVNFISNWNVNFFFSSYIESFFNSHHKWLNNKDKTIIIKLKSHLIQNMNRKVIASVYLMLVGEKALINIKK